MGEEVRLAARPLDDVDLTAADSLDAAVLARARGMRRETDRRRFLAGRLVARSLVAELLGLPESTITARAHCADCLHGNDGSHGEPRYFSDGKLLPLAASFSRSGGWLVAALSGPGAAGRPVERIGVDVEDAASPAFATAELEDVMASAGEKTTLAGVTARDRPRLRAGLWVRKEALLKADGHGLRVDPRTVETLTGEWGGLHVDDVGPGQLGLPPRLVVALATGTPAR